MRNTVTAAITLGASIFSFSLSYAGISTANQPNKRPPGPQAASGTGAIPPNFSPGAGWVYGQRPFGRPAGERYWYTPDFVRIFKIRGGGDDNFRTGAEGTRRETLPLLSWNLKSWNEQWNTGLSDFSADALSKHSRRGSLRGTSLGVRLDGGWSNVPEFEGWGTGIPYLGISKGTLDKLTKDDVIRDTGVRDTTGTLRDKPFDGGITRYELWVGKKASTTLDQQGNPGGWGQTAWFFDSYNVVNQAGQVLGTLRTETSDSQSPSTRAFRNSPYLVEATETPLINRTFTASQDGGKVQLRELPKMLVLLAPAANQRQDYSFGRYQSGSAEGGRSRVDTPRKYGRDAGAGTGGTVMQNDQGNMLAPNSNVDEKAGEAGQSGIALHWEKTRLNGKDAWTFRKWQRAENLFRPNNPRGAAWHKWVLETKSDALYAPSGRDGNAIVTPREEDLKELPEMVVGMADVQGFDTGGFAVAGGGRLSAANAVVYGDPDDITDGDIVSVLPIGRFYPTSAVYVAVEYRLLDRDGNPEGVSNPRDWSTAKTAALFYWNSDGSAPKVVQDTALAEQSIDKRDPSLTPRRIRFASSGTFDPYTDAWLVSVRDLAHTSAEYRLRIFMGLPFKPINAGSLMPARQGVGQPGAVTSLNREFNADQMAGILRANQAAAISYTPGANPMEESFAFQDPAYQGICREAGIRAAGFSLVGTVDDVSPEVVEKIVGAAERGVRNKAGIQGGAEKWTNPWFTGSSTDFPVQWFEYSNSQNGVKSWKVQVPDVAIGVDDEAAGVIITE
jgi:hypothetical protein